MSVARGTERTTPPAYDRRIGLTPLWFGMLGGPIAWLGHLALAYLVVTLACIAGLEGARILLYGVTAMLAAVALAAALVAAWCWRRSGAGGDDLGESGGRAGFMAVTGALLSGISFMVILVESMAIPFLQPCE